MQGSVFHLSPPPGYDRGISLSIISLFKDSAEPLFCEAFLVVRVLFTCYLQGVLKLGWVVDSPK